MTFNLKAIEIYQEAQLMPGSTGKGQKQLKIHEGIAAFPSLDLAIEDAQENIARFTKSDFTTAWFYEMVLLEAKILKEAASS